MLDDGLRPDGFERVDRREQRDDRRLVVGRRARVDARVRALSPRTTGVNGSGWFHFFAIDRLAVVVAVEQDGARGAGHVQRAIDERIAVRLEDLAVQAHAGSAAS